MSYTIEWEENGVSITFSKTVTSEDLIQSAYEIFGVAEFDDMKYQLVDTLAVTQVQINKTDMKKIAALDKAAAKSNPRVFVAVVATLEMIKELSQFYAEENQDSPWKTQVFETIKDAKSWIEEQLS